MKLSRAFCQSALRARQATLGEAFAGAESVSTDTRSIGAGDLFVALRGDNFDAHDFVGAALKAGACAALVERVPEGVPAAKCIVVDDALHALQDLAEHHLGRCDATRICLSGSNGKTTTKELIAACMRASLGPSCVLATQGNFNNHIGMPLTALRANEGHRAIILEIGMNHFGELTRLCEIAKPMLGLLTNIGNAHAGNLGGVEGVAKAKAELFEGLASGGTALINLEDERVVAEAKRVLDAGCKQVTFGQGRGDVSVERATAAPGGMQLSFRHAGAQADVLLPLVGAHNAVNAAGAVAVAVAAGCDFKQAVTGLAQVANIPGRLAIHEDVGGRLLIDDTYNANPDSARAAVQALLERAGGRRAVAVLGDMLELGDDASAQHAEVAEMAVREGVTRLFVCGELGRGYVEGAKRAGLSSEDVTWATNSLELADWVAAGTGKGDALVVKGSRGARMERVVARLLEDTAAHAQDN